MWWLSWPLRRSVLWPLGRGGGNPFAWHLATAQVCPVATGEGVNCSHCEAKVTLLLHAAQVVVCALGPGSRMSDAKALVAAFRAISAGQPQQQLLSGGGEGPESAKPSGGSNGANGVGADWDAVSATALPPRDAFFAPTVRQVDIIEFQFVFRVPIWPLQPDNR